jgi:hypothetical protein
MMRMRGRSKVCGLVLVIVAGALVLSLTACWGLSVSKPRIGNVPAGWELVEEYGYGTYKFNKVKLGGMLYEDAGGSFVLVMYGDVPGWVAGADVDETDPLTKMIETTSIFKSAQTGSMIVGGYSADYYKSCSDGHCEMGISFVKGYPWIRGATWIGIYTYYNTADEDDVLSLIDSIYF